MMIVLIGALAMGFMFAPLAMGVFLSYRILRFPDVTVDGSFVLGAVIAARLIDLGMDPISATVLGALGGIGSGMMTGLLITRFKIERMLAGILVAMALYGINLIILTQGSFAYEGHITLYEYARDLAEAVFGTRYVTQGLGVQYSPARLVSMLFSGGMVLVLSTAMVLFFRTRFGLAMRAAGSNGQATRAVGANVSLHIVATLAVSNALAALTGAIWTQYYGSVALTDGVGYIVIGLACVLIGETFLKNRTFAVRLLSAILGATIYELIRSLLMYTGLTGDYFKLISTIIVLLALLVPDRVRALRQRRIEQRSAA
ncbi:ABC transporter permease [bacterium]|nr:ABC transporter permease [bacterium]